jgi:eukaryotic-like serine/threonine-protein kinase
MPLSVGTKLGPYEILAPLGKGGMGEVYRARDTKLDREVAIKVLPTALAQDPERLARFEREAKVLASLNHPNIAQIHAIEEVGGIRALVMELIPGQTLKGPISLYEALRVAAQVADALGAAHEKGITHRDLKPLNVMITPEGVVKVLDFGLAAVAQPSGAQEGDLSQSPTVTISPTRAGMILGTAAYMSPEQARGQSVDRRSDIWAFGVLLYEMLTGKQLFHGKHCFRHSGKRAEG